MQVMQKAVADNQISLPQKCSLQNLLEGQTKERNFHAMPLRPFAGQDQHGFCTINANDSCMGKQFGKAKRDVSRSATKINHQRLGRQR